MGVCSRKSWGGRCWGTHSKYGKKVNPLCRKGEGGGKGKGGRGAHKKGKERSQKRGRARKKDGPSALENPALDELKKSWLHAIKKTGTSRKKRSCMLIQGGGG